MDGPTEPLIAVIDDPIAGNPSQLAIEFALRSLGLEYHVNSFHVLPENITAALDGLQVLGYRGVLIGDHLALLAGAWSKNETEQQYDGPPLSGFYRDADDPQKFAVADVHGLWLASSVKKHFADCQTQIDQCLWLGNRNRRFPADLVAREQITLSTRAPTVQSVIDSNLIVLSPGPKGDVPLDINEWPANDGSSLIVDLTDGREEICSAAEKGYAVISSRDRQIGTIAGCIELWTGTAPSTTIIQEAIEEYLSV